MNEKKLEKKINKYNMFQFVFFSGNVSYIVADKVCRATD